MGGAAKKGCLTVLTIFMVGFGSCVGLIFVDKGVKQFNHARDDSFLRKLEKKFQNGTATAEELVALYKAQSNYHAVKTKTPRLVLLQKAHQTESRMAAAYLAQYYFERVYPRPKRDNAEKLAEKTTQMTEAVNIVATELEKSCSVEVFPFTKYGQYRQLLSKPKRRVDLIEFTKIKSLRDKAHYPALIELHNRLNVILLRHKVLCGKSTRYSDQYGKRIDDDKFAIAFALEGLTGRSQATENPQQPTADIAEKAVQLIEAYNKYYPN